MKSQEQKIEEIRENMCLLLELFGLKPEADERSEQRDDHTGRG